MRKIQFNQNLPEASKSPSFNASEHNPNKLLPQKGTQIPRNWDTLSSRISFSPHPIPALPYPGTGKNNLKGRLPNRPSTFYGGRISTEAFWWHGAPGKQNQGREGVLLKSLVCNSFQRRIHWHLDLKTCNYYIVSERLFYRQLLVEEIKFEIKFKQEYSCSSNPHVKKKSFQNSLLNQIIIM